MLINSVLANNSSSIIINPTVKSSSDFVTDPGSKELNHTVNIGKVNVFNVKMVEIKPTTGITNTNKPLQQ